MHTRGEYLMKCNYFLPHYVRPKINIFLNPHTEDRKHILLGTNNNKHNVLGSVVTYYSLNSSVAYNTLANIIQWTIS